MQKVFFKNLSDRDPNLFKKYGDNPRDKSNFYQFTKGCPGQYRRQPIILSDEEKNKIDELDRKVIQNLMMNQLDMEVLVIKNIITFVLDIGVLKMMKTWMVKGEVYL